MNEILIRNSCGKKGGPEPTLSLVDSRPESYAKANKLKGMGHENIDIYQNCKLVFLGIGNIHNVRDSFTRLRELCHMRSEGT